MAYFFDLENYTSTCNIFGEQILKSIYVDDKISKNKYYQQYGNLDGYTPTQSTVVLNDDGSINVFVNSEKTKTPLEVGGFCCENKLPSIIQQANSKIGVFSGVDTKTIYWDADKQVCRWKQTTDTCVLDSFKVVLNAVENDGAIFNVGNGEKDCSLEIDFNYLFKMDCQNLANILNPTISTTTDPVTLEKINRIQNIISEQKASCEQISSQINIKTSEFEITKYSIVSCPDFTPFIPNTSFQNLTSPFSYGISRANFINRSFVEQNIIYCINEENGGLVQFENILGVSNYKRFLDGAADSYTCDDVTAMVDINNQLIRNNQPQIITECTTPFGYKSNLKVEIDALVVKQQKCQTIISELESELNSLLTNNEVVNSCKTPIEALETLDVSIVLDVINSDGSLSTVFETELFNSIGSGNLYSYLKDRPYDSGFYLCGEPKSNETWASGCTALNYSETYNNVSSCKIIKDSLLNSLKDESGLSNSNTDLQTFNDSLSDNIFASKWLNNTTLIDDVEILDKIKNKKIKLSLKINNTCSNVCIYIDNIKLNRKCVDGNGNSILISQSPGFQLERIIDNKKSWLRNSSRVNREFNIANNEGQNMIRKTDYDVNDERLIINTKEIDLDINIASAIENDVQCFINDNTNLLDSVPMYDCGCSIIPCYKDVFNIITHAEAFALTGTITQYPEDYATSIRAMRDAWLKSWNEYNLATIPYLDIKDSIYSPIIDDYTLENYVATKVAYRKAIYEFNRASGSGYIEGLTEKPNLRNLTETIVPQVFETKCGRIIKFPSTSTIESGNFYIVETLDKQVKLYTTDTSVAPETTWIDLSNLLEEEYPSDWILTSTSYLGTTIPEKREYFCKILGSKNNYISNLNLTNFHYPTNNNTQNNKWIRPINENFYIDWDSTKGKCMTNMFKQVVPEEFSMYPAITDVTSINKTYMYSPECDLDILARNSGSTACSIYGVDWSYPTILNDVQAIRRYYRDAQTKLGNEYFLTTDTPLFNVIVKDPLTNNVPDETSGYIPVKVTTTIRKGSRTGDIVFQEEYVLNDDTATCSYRTPFSSYGLKTLKIPIGLTDPNGLYRNSLISENSIYCSSDYGTYITGSTSTMPYPGASNDATNRNWAFDVDYYVHLDIINNITNEVYYTPNNDFNLKDRNLPIKCPSSASTETFNISTALNTIQLHKEKVMSEIQEDLDWALNNCTNC